MHESNKYLRLIAPRYWLAWLGIGLLWLMTLLPYRGQLYLGKTIGNIFYFFPSKLKSISQVNIQLCFPELSSTDQKHLVKKNFSSLGMGLIEAAMACWGSDRHIQHLIKFKLEGMDYLEKALAKGKGAILLGPHFTCLEIVGRLISMYYAFAVMYRPHKKPFIAFIQERFRKKNYLQYIPRDHIRELIRALHNNVAVWYAYDIDAGIKRSVFAPFFGIPTASLTSVTRIVNLSGAAVIPICFYRKEDDLSYEIRLYPALENFPTGDAVEDGTQLNAALERAIRQKPEQYVWQYKRFKTRPLHEPRFY